MIAPRTLARLAAEYRSLTERQLAVEMLVWDLRGDIEDREADAHEVTMRGRYELERRGTDGR